MAVSQNTQIRADLGPTNTGKTHRAIARLLQHQSGMIGLPLRLLAREVYDRICAQIDPKFVALLTGEERIIGTNARYWVATVEAMPRALSVDIVIVDEIQLAADPERGYIFTERLLHARGHKETLFLGSHAFRSMIKTLLPDVHIETSERLSKLSWLGRKKLATLPPRSAIVAFSAGDVYAIAEYLRRQHGGAAVVMGALSPRTRNAQVDLFQSGQVDYLVATDAIGMGLNLDLENVFFAGTAKFDGRKHRDLFPHELAQIAGRAGRYTRDGYFGTTAQAEAFDEPVISAIETHKFAPIRRIEWRNHDLSFASIDALLRSLETESKTDILKRSREADDLRALRHMSRLEHVREETKTPAHVERLWQICQLPDFPKFSSGDHLALIERLYQAYHSPLGRISNAELDSVLRKIEKPHQNIEILGRKLAQIRTWAYIAQRKDWIEEPSTWRARTREVEDALSDALHEALIQNFVDERSSKLRKRLREKEVIMAEVNANGEVTIEGNFVGQLNGFRFELDPSAEGAEAKTIAAAAKEALAPVYNLRTEKFYASDDKALSFSDSYAILWEDAPIASLKKGVKPLEPKINALVDEDFPQELREKIERRVSHWLERRRAEQLAPLLAIDADESLTGLVRGIGYQIVEALGVLPRADIAEDIKTLSQEDRALLRQHGVRFGQYSVFCPALLKPAPTELRLALSSIWREEAEIVAPPPAGLVTIPADPSYAPHHYALAGYRLLGARAIRVDMLERLADLLREQDRRGGFEASPDMLSITGLTLEQFANLMGGLGFAAERGERAPEEKESASTDETQSDAPSEANAEQAKTAKADTAEAADASAPEDTPAEPVVYYTFRTKPRPNARGARPNQANARDKKPRGKGKGKPQARSASSAPKKSDKAIDPDNPFAALMALKGKS